VKHQLFNKKIPTILVILLITLGIPLTMFAIKNQTIFQSKASDSQEPQDIKITNISNKSFTISYQTNTPTTGSISYGLDEKLGKSELDDIDKEKGSFSPKKIHSITIKELMPATKYHLSIISGSNTYLDTGTPFEITTGTNISSPSSNMQAVKGKIVLPDGNAPSEALIYLNAENSQLLSSTTTKDGVFSFSLKDLRTNNLSSYFDMNNNAVFKIFATNGSLKSTALVSLNQVESIPTITLSNDYNFVQEASPISSKSAETSGFPSIISSSDHLKPAIINPKKDQSLTDQKPQFRGTSLPNEKVEIIIHSDEQITAQVTADRNGNWTYKPTENLSPGIHTITIKTRDSQGILITIMQSFTVFAAESQLSKSPTPSAAPIPTPTTSPAPSIITLSPTVAPALTLSSPTPIPIQTISKGGLPPAGDSRIIFVTIAAIATTATGIALFLLSQKILL
jgi:hypothetical protein